MPRNLIICCDGTSNEFGSANTNVVRLCQVLDRDPRRQSLYYDPGVGTLPEPGWASALGKWFSKIRGLAFGAGITRNIAEAYCFLMDHYQAGDQLFLFGFSRGAYTVRALAGVLHQFGLLSPGNDNLVPYMLRLSKAVNGLDRKSLDARRQYWNVCREFKSTFARPTEIIAGIRAPLKIHFLGLWDTVSSLGWFWNPRHYPYTANNRSVEIVRHAIALDERRWFFRQNTWAKPDPGSTQDVLEAWFPGVHADVGGGYAEDEGSLWRVPFLWMVREARRAGLVVDRKKLQVVLERAHHAGPSWAAQKHESLTWKWWPAELFPKLPARRGLRWPRFGLWRGRTVPGGVFLHRSVLRRLRRADPLYQPPNLSALFRQSVTTLPALPEYLRYQPGQ